MRIHTVCLSLSLSRFLLLPIVEYLTNYRHFRSLLIRFITSIRAQSPTQIQIHKQNSWYTWLQSNIFHSRDWIRKLRGDRGKAFCRTEDEDETKTELESWGRVSNFFSSGHSRKPASSNTIRSLANPVNFFYRKKVGHSTTAACQGASNSSNELSNR